MRFAALLAGCLCLTDCGGCVDEGSAPTPPSEPPQTQVPAPSFRPMPLPLRGFNLMLRDAGAAD
jgi:hypothetical protein